MRHFAPQVLQLGSQGGPKIGLGAPWNRLGSILAPKCSNLAPKGVSKSVLEPPFGSQNGVQSPPKPSWRRPGSLLAPLREVLGADRVNS